MANLLIGNGINLLTNNAIKWEDLIKGLAKSVTDDPIDMTGKSNLHSYEELYSKAARNRKNEDAIRSKIVDFLKETSANTYHEIFITLPFENILTTNYDYGFTPNPRSPQKGDETIYSLKRFQRVNDKKIWHIHGEINSPKSIMLGYDHYMKSIGKIQGHLKSKHKSLNSSNETWIDLFLNDDLYILGLGLNFDEIDLWWLLAYRNRQILEKKIKETNFIYIDIIDMNKIDDKTRNSINDPYNPKTSMLDAYNVEVHPFYIGYSCHYKNYSEAYDAIIQYLVSKKG